MKQLEVGCVRRIKYRIRFLDYWSKIQSAVRREFAPVAIICKWMPCPLGHVLYMDPKMTAQNEVRGVHESILEGDEDSSFGFS